MGDSIPEIIENFVKYLSMLFEAIKNFLENFTKKDAANEGADTAEGGTE